MIKIKDDKEEFDVELSLENIDGTIELCATNSVTKEKVILLSILPDGKVATFMFANADWLKEAGFEFNDSSYLIIK